jgi:hypothetical protein
MGLRQNMGLLLHAEKLFPLAKVVSHISQYQVLPLLPSAFAQYTLSYLLNWRWLSQAGMPCVLVVSFYAGSMVNHQGDHSTLKFLSE